MQTEPRAFACKAVLLEHDGKGAVSAAPQAVPLAGRHVQRAPARQEGVVCPRLVQSGAKGSKIAGQVPYAGTLRSSAGFKPQLTVCVQRAPTCSQVEQRRQSDKLCNQLHGGWGEGPARTQVSDLRPGQHGRDGASHGEASLTDGALRSGSAAPRPEAHGLLVAF